MRIQQQALEGHSMVHSLFLSQARSVAVGCLLALASASIALADPIKGAGSTFAAPIIKQWSRAYEAARTDGGEFTSPDWQVDYEPVGSLAGVMRLAQPELDFAVTDVPLNREELKQRNFAQFPIVMGGIAVVANIPGLKPGQLRLSGAVLADIYLGKISKWSDAAIASMNPDVKLPDAAIAVLHREDGSGSTAAFTGLLAKTSPEWRHKVGSGTLVTWPVGQGERGTGALAAVAAAAPQAIAYLEYGQAARLGIPYAAIQNQAGAFVQPEAKSFQAGLVEIAWDPATGFAADTTNLTGDGAYPMAVVSYAVVPTERDPARVQRVLDLFRLAMSDGAKTATALQYIPIPKVLVGQIEAYWSATFAASIDN